MEAFWYMVIAASLVFAVGMFLSRPRHRKPSGRRPA